MVKESCSDKLKEESLKHIHFCIMIHKGIEDHKKPLGICQDSGMPATVNSNIVDPINVNIPLFTSSELLGNDICWFV